MNNKIGIVSLGCAKNLINSEQMMFLLIEAGYYVSGETDEAEVIIINTCGFIESAKVEAIDTIIEFGKMKEQGRVNKLIVAGCLTERYKKEIMLEMPEIDAIVGVGSYDDIVSVVEAIITADKKVELIGDINTPISETGRIITTSPVWTYLKIADGCDNRCAYCVIPEIRGRYRSRPIENIINEAKYLAQHGIKELIVVAQDVTSYGQDLYGVRKLPSLLRELSDIESLKWIRLHYLYPDSISKELIDEVAKNDKILKYMDIPIQHINNDILKNMNRRGTGDEIRALFHTLRERIPGVVLRTSIITGLPGEGEKEFDELYDFMENARIERAGVFAYSPEEGTKAALMDRPDSDVAIHRAELLSDLSETVMEEFNDNRIGEVITVLIDGYEEGRYLGRSYAESPDIDGYIQVIDKEIMQNEFVDVRITGIENGEPVAIVV